MSNLIARQPAVNAETGATQMSSVQAGGNATAARDVSKIDASTAKGKEALAKKQEFDAALSQTVTLSDASKKAAAEAMAQAGIDAKTIVGAKTPSAQVIDPKAAKVAAHQEKDKKRVSEQAAALAQIKGAQHMPAALQVAFGTQPLQSAKAAAGGKTGGVQVQNQLQTPQTQKQSTTDAQALVNGLNANQFTSNGVDQPRELAGFNLVQDMNYQGDVQEVGQDKAGAAAFNAAQATQKTTAASSTLSTDDYLNLRNFSNAQGASLKKPTSKLNLNTAELGTPGSAAGQAHLQVRDGQALPIKTLDAPVTTGSMMKPVLSHDALHQMTGQLSSMNFAKQDGEIKIRLKPDHLGELSMSVRNHGSQVSIRIQAENPEAKQIIESSLNSLRDSLSQQNLTVTRLEVTQAPAPIQSAGQDGMNMQMGMGQFRQQGSDLGFQQQQQQESNANSNYWREEESNRPRPAATSTSGIGAARTNTARSGNQGLDLIA
ncbi:MAG: flagellar hook-length control protein FliK [Bdellovibrionales bacterium]|nr:flagellar hook-length control protein FliK [Bdellovibrionales bacterium]